MIVTPQAGVNVAVWLTDDSGPHDVVGWNLRNNGNCIAAVDTVAREVPPCDIRTVRLLSDDGCGYTEQHRDLRLHKPKRSAREVWFYPTRELVIDHPISDTIVYASLTGGTPAVPVLAWSPSYDDEPIVFDVRDGRATCVRRTRRTCYTVHAPGKTTFYDAALSQLVPELVETQVRRSAASAAGVGAVAQPRK